MQETNKLQLKQILKINTVNKLKTLRLLTLCELQKGLGVDSLGETGIPPFPTKIKKCIVSYIKNHKRKTFNKNLHT